MRKCSQRKVAPFALRKEAFSLNRKQEPSSRQIFWQQRIQKWRDSGKTQVQWCKEQEIFIHTFRTWIKRKNRQSRQETLPQWISIEEEDFRPCPQTPVYPQENSGQPHRDAGPAEIRILYEKVKVCLPAEISPDYLAQILLTLGPVMRKSINGLAEIVQGSFQLDPYEEPCLSSVTGTRIKSKFCSGIRMDLYSTTNVKKKDDSRGL